MNGYNAKHLSHHLGALAILLACAGHALADATFETGPGLGADTTLDMGAPAGAAGAAGQQVDLGASNTDHLRKMIDDAAAVRSATKTAASTAPSEEGQAGKIQLQLDDPKKASKDTLFYDEAEVDARAAALKSKVKSMLDKDVPEELSNEERELELQKQMALSQIDSGKNGNNNRSDTVLKKRLQELAFLIWDLLTHPATIALVVIAAVIRLVVAINRVSNRGSKHRSSKQHSSGRRTTRAPSAPAQGATITEYEQREERRRQRHYAQRRRGRHRRSWLDRFRSV